MRIQLFILAALNIGLWGCSNAQTGKNNIEQQTESIVRIEMNLSAFGVESDDFPSIDAVIDFSADTSYCRKWFFNPAHKDSVYRFTRKEMQNILTLLKVSDLEKLKGKYEVSSTDEPSSRTIIYTSKNKIVIKDYGLEGEYPLQELYKIVYKY